MFQPTQPGPHQPILSHFPPDVQATKKLSCRSGSMEPCTAGPAPSLLWLSVIGYMVIWLVTYWLYGYWCTLQCPLSPGIGEQISIALAPHRKVLLCPQAHTPATLSSAMTHRDAKDTSPFPQCMSLLSQSTPVFSPPHHLILFCLQIYRPLPHLLGALRGQGYFPLQHLALGKSS